MGKAKVGQRELLRRQGRGETEKGKERRGGKGKGRKGKGGETRVEITAFSLR